MGRRLAACRNGIATRYVYDASGNLLAEADENNAIVRYYIYGCGLLAMATASDQLYCYHFDGTGNTIAMTDASQAVVNSYAYTPFGIIVNSRETMAQPFKYVGEYGVMAEPNGLCYMRNRYYDPEVGRFISEDPIGFDGGDVNLYAYVQNDPVNAVDPFGLHGLMLMGRGSYVTRPSILRGPQRYVPPVRPLKETTINPKYVPKPADTIEMPKSWWGRWLEKWADFFGWGGGGATGIGGINVSDPCESKNDPVSYHPIYNPGGII